MIFFHWGTSFIYRDGVDQQNIFYFYSSAAQIIATFIAFLIAGYTLVYQAMDNLENRDDTLKEVHHKIKVDYYLKIKKLCILTGTTIAFCLTVLWLNSYSDNIIKDIIVITDSLVLLTIVMGLWFVVYIIDPNKIRKAAIELLKKEFPSGESVDEGTFAKVFIKLERKIREITRKYDLPIKSKYFQKDFVSLRDMIESFYRYEVIGKELYLTLMELNKYRNLVMHGHINEVDINKVKKAEDALNEISSIELGLEDRYSNNMHMDSLHS